MIPDEEEEREKETSNAILALKELLKSPGWAILTEILEAQIKQRTDNIMLKPRGSEADEWEKEYQKGEASAMRFILELPKTELDSRRFEKDTKDA